MKKIKVIQIGIAHDHGWSTYGTIRNSDLYDVAAVVIPEGEEWGLERVNRLVGGLQETPVLSLEDALNIEGLDAAIIETHDVDLTRYGIIAAERGLHIQMDKPGSIDQASFEKLLSIQKKNNKLFHFGYMYRYTPAIVKLMQDIKDGKLGEVYSVGAQMNSWLNKEKRAWLAQFPGGMLYHLGCHLIDLIVQIQGVPDEIIPLSTATGIDGVEAQDFGMAAFRYHNGISTAQSTSTELGGYFRRQLVVCGSKGTVELKPLEFYSPPHENWIVSLHTDVRETFERGWNATGNFYQTEPHDRYIPMMDAFAAMVRGEIENPYTYEYEARLHRILLRACGVDIDYKAPIVF